jgi:hypothetical protein
LAGRTADQDVDFGCFDLESLTVDVTPTPTKAIFPSALDLNVLDGAREHVGAEVFSIRPRCPAVELDSGYRREICLPEAFGKAPGACEQIGDVERPARAGARTGR